MMKKYRKPTMDKIEVETSSVMSMSLPIYNETTDIQLSDRKRDASWSEYEGR